jgi:hypothetical protein
MTNPLRALTEAVADRVHAAADAEARAYGLTVQRLPWGRRRVYDRRVAGWLEQRRRRVLRDGPDPVDRALLDPATAQALAATAASMPGRRRTPARSRPPLTLAA